MKTNVQKRIQTFLTSEEGKVGIKAPLTLGIATGSILMAQAIIGPTPALACGGNDDCRIGEVCGEQCFGPPDENGDETCIVTCYTP